MQEPNTLLEGKYEILNKIREGGMGTIYLVRHRLLDRIRVIKVMRAHAVADPDLKRRFLEEAKMATRLNHPNICTIHDFALDEEATAYLVMEFIDGVNLAELLALRGPPGLPLSLEITHQALLALGYLHRNRIIHRDVAPDNLMLARDEELRPLIKLIDLGIAKATDKPTAMTMTGVFLGKLRYASPEQFGTLRPGEMLDGRSDIYSLGVVLYELATGVRPFSGDSPGELLHGHLSTAPLPFAQSDPEGKVPLELRAAILKALEKRREDRFPSTEEFDRVVLLCKETYTRPDDLRDSGEILAAIPRLERVHDRTVTPSAQDRLDRQFGAHSTPRPSGDLLTAVPGPSEATEETSSASKVARQQTLPIPPKPPSPRVPTSRPAPPIPKKLPPTEMLPAPPRRPRRAGLWILAAGLAAAVALVVLMRRQATPVAEAPALEPTAVPAAPLQIKPQPAVLPEPTASSVSEPAIELTVPMPTARPARPSVESTSREQLEAAALSASRARLSSERVRAPDLAGEAYRRGRAKEAEAQRLAARGRNGPAEAAYDLAARIYAQSEAAARTVVPTPPSAAAIATREEPAPQPVEPAKPVIAAAPQREGAAPVAPTSPGHAGSSDQDRIRETVRSYERAQSTLDAEMYARIFPTVDRARIAGAFQNLISQTVEFEIRRIEVDPNGAHAEVHGFERRVAIPRAGPEQRLNAARVIYVEKRGDSWVISRLN